MCKEWGTYVPSRLIYTSVHRSHHCKHNMNEPKENEWSISRPGNRSALGEGGESEDCEAR